MLSRVLGLVRDVLMAALFGTTAIMSAFTLAFTLPNLFRRLFGEGALSSAFIPVFIETKEKEGETSAWTLAHRVFSITTLILTLVTILGIVAAIFLRQLPDLSTKTATFLRLLPIMLPYLVFICLAGLSMGTLNSYGHFAVPAATPCLLNIIWIIAIVLVCPFADSMPEKITIIAWAILAAGMAQLAAQLPILRRYGYRAQLDWKPSDEKVRRIITLAGPAALAMAITQFNVLIDKGLALWISDWAASALYFSERLIYLPQGIFATALGTVLLPTFSKQAAQGDQQTLRRTVTFSLRMLLFIMVPAAVGLLGLAFPIVELVYERGAFHAASTWQTAVALQFYALGLIVFGLPKIFAPAFYSLQDTKTPMRIGLATVALNLILNILFITTFPANYKHAGLALGTVLAETFYAITLALLLQKRIGNPGWKPVWMCLARSITASIAMVFAAIITVKFSVGLLEQFGWQRFYCRAGSVTAALAVGIAVYALSAFLLRSSEMREVISAIKRKKA